MTEYERLEKLLEYEPLWVEAVSQDGETILIERDSYNKEEGYWVIKETIFQKNGWLCIHYYHKDGTIEELFER